MGKTRLAVRVGELVLDRYADGVWWVDLASVAEDESVARRVAEVFDLADQPGTDPVTLLMRYLARRRALLILDNCEHLTGSAAILATELLEAASSLTILATSRRPLLASGESRYQVPSLTVSSTELGLSDAERLFHERAAQADSGFVTTSDNTGDVARICRDLDGLPLAIEMAAAHVNLLSPAQIAGHLDDRFRLLTTDAGAVHGRHASLTATFDWSYDLLPPNRQLLFDQLGVFAGPFDLTACEAVAAETDLSPGSIVADLGALVDASMVVAMRSDGSMRYRLLDTLRIYSRDRLVARGETDAVASRHSHYFLSLAEESGLARMTPDHAATVTALNRSNDDLLAALEWSLDNEARSVTLTAAPGLAQYWFRRGDPAASYLYGMKMLEGAKRTDAHLRAAALICVTFGAQLAGDFEASASTMQDAMRLLHGGDDWRTLLWGLYGQGTSALMTGNPAGAAQAGAAILDVCSDRGVTLPRGYGLALLGMVEFFGDGDLELARGYFEDAVALFRAIGDESALNIAGLGLLASVAALQGDYEAAERHAVEATTLGGPGWAATALIILAGNVLHPMGEIDRAERSLLRGLTMAHERSIEIWTRTGLLMLGSIAGDRGQWERAARLHGASRRNLPPWMHQAWSKTEAAIRQGLGDTNYERIAAAGESEDLDRLVLWAVAETSAQ